MYVLTCMNHGYDGVEDHAVYLFDNEVDLELAKKDLSRIYGDLRVDIPILNAWDRPIQQFNFAIKDIRTLEGDLEVRDVVTPLGRPLFSEPRTTEDAYGLRGINVKNIYYISNNKQESIDGGLKLAEEILSRFKDGQQFIEGKYPFPALICAEEFDDEGFVRMIMHNTAYRYNKFTQKVESQPIKPPIATKWEHYEMKCSG